MTLTRAYILAALLLRFGPASADGSNDPVPPATAALTFTENKGQVSDQYDHPRPDVRFYGEQGPMSFYITDKGISYQFTKPCHWKELATERDESQTARVVDSTRSHRVDVEWVAANSDGELRGMDTSGGYENFYLASCPSGVRNVRSYERVVRKNLYPGIDLVYYNADGRLKYDLLVAGKVDERVIRFKVAGARPNVDADGRLILECPLGEVIEDAPIVRQNGKLLKAAWRVQDNLVSFVIRREDPDAPMVIDPALRVWCTYYGGAAMDSIEDVTCDHVGRAYVCGSTYSTTLIATSGAHQTTKSAGPDAFLAKFSTNGARLWGTYLGGTGIDLATSVEFDPMIGAVYLAGRTTSFTSITTAGTHQVGLAGDVDGFLLRFDGTGARIWGTYLGGEGYDSVTEITLDPLGNVYAGGYTLSQNEGAISTPGCHQPDFGGGPTDGFICKFSSEGTRIWGTYIGGSNGLGMSEGVNGIDCGPDGRLAVYGATPAIDPGTIATPDAFQTTGTALCAFLTVFSPTGVQQWGTFYGGNIINDVTHPGWHGCAWDPSGNVFITGRALWNQSNLLTEGFPEPVAQEDIFLAKFDGTGQRLWSRWCGGPGLFNQSNGISTDQNGGVYLAGHLQNGYTGIIGIGTAGSYQEMPATPGPSFLARYRPDGQRSWGTYFEGGPGQMIGSGSCVDPYGNVYLAGFTQGTELGTPGVHQTSFAGGYDGYLAKFCAPVEIESLLIEGPLRCDETGVATVMAFGGSNGLGYTWIGDINMSTTNTALYEPGTTGSVIVSGLTGACASSDTMAVVVPLPPGLGYSTEVIDALCAGDSTGAVDITITQGTAPYVFDWSDGSDAENLTGVPAGTYHLYVVDDHNCAAELEFVVGEPEALEPTIADTNEPLCADMATGSIDLEVAGGTEPYSYEWSNGFTQQDPHSLAADIYSVTITDAHGCEATLEATIEEPDGLSIVADVTNEAFGNDGAIDITVSGGTPGYTYDWSNDSTTADLTGLEGGVYTVHVTDQNGCEDSLQVQVGSSVGLADIGAGTRWSVAFDPSAQAIVILGVAQTARVDVMDACGRLMESHVTNGISMSIPTAHFASGIYLVRSHADPEAHIRRVLVYR